MINVNIDSNSILARRDKINYYLDIAEVVSERSTCLKRKYGCIIVKDDEIISSGFNGAPRGVISCLECKKCFRENSERGMDYSNCISVHAEQNAIISAPRNRMIGATMYLVGIQEICEVEPDQSKVLPSYHFVNSFKYVDNPSPCSICKRMIANAGIEKIVMRIDKNVSKTISVDTLKDDTNNFIGGY